MNYSPQDVRKQGSSPHAPNFRNLATPRTRPTPIQHQEIATLDRSEGCYSAKDHGQRCQASWCGTDQGVEEERVDPCRFQGGAEYGHADGLGGKGRALGRLFFWVSGRSRRWPEPDVMSTMLEHRADMLRTRSWRLSSSSITSPVLHVLYHISLVPASPCNNRPACLSFVQQFHGR